MKKTMIAGGAVFVGSHLCGHLLRAGHDMPYVDNFFTGPVNLGNPEKLTILELVERAMWLMKRRSRIRFKCPLGRSQGAQIRYWAGKKSG
jgi:nucleoside-diphosphate-sugar epimerase